MATDSGRRKYVSRYARRPSHAVKPIQPSDLQPRDHEIIRLLGAYRCIRQQELLDYLSVCTYQDHNEEEQFYGMQGSKQRIRRLLDNHYVDVLDQDDGRNLKRPEPGSKTRNLALGDRGAEIYYRDVGRPAPKVSWRDKNREMRFPSISHQLLISSTMLAFEKAAKESLGRFRLVHPHELITNAAPELAAQPDPFVWDVRVTWKKHELKVAARPDYIFAIELADKRRALYFLEADRGSETVVPNKVQTFKEKATIYRKNLALFTTFSQRDHLQRFGFKKGFYVLWVTSGHDGRIASIVNNAKAVTEGKAPNLFLVTSDASRREHGILDVPWNNAAGEAIRLRF